MRLCAKHISYIVSIITYLKKVVPHYVRGRDASLNINHRGKDVEFSINEWGKDV